jgi:hypothetical protein
MGAFTFSLDRRIVECLKRALPLPYFVETGTFEGESIHQIASLFERTFTVELSETLFRLVRERFANQPSVSLHQGSSPEFLRDLSEQLHEKSVLYWLDAHWCVAQGTAGEQSQCPLLEELTAIGSLNDSSIVLIDDARLFLCTPPAPHEATDWPTFHAILKSLRRLNPDHYLQVINDVIFYYPPTADAAVREFAREHGADLMRYVALVPALKEVEADRAERLKVIHRLDAALKESEVDRANRLDAILTLDAALKQSEAERAECSKSIVEVTAALRQSESEGAVRLEEIRKLEAALEQSEAERVNQQETVQQLVAALSCAEAAVRETLEAKQKLEGLLRGHGHTLAGLFGRLGRRFLAKRRRPQGDAPPYANSRPQKPAA